MKTILASALFFVLSCCCATGTYTTKRGASFTGNTAWMDQAEAEREELEAADIISRQLGYDRARMLASLQGVVIEGIDRPTFVCGDVVNAVGCTHLSETPIRIEIAEGFGAMCARQGATYRHEAAHVMLAAVGHDDGQHLLPVWPALDEWTVLCF